MKDLRVTDEDLLLLMDAVNLMESAFVYTHRLHDRLQCEPCRLKELANKIRIAWEDK